MVKKNVKIKSAQVFYDELLALLQRTDFDCLEFDKQLDYDSEKREFVDTHADRLAKDTLLLFTSLRTQFTQSKTNWFNRTRTDQLADLIKNNPQVNAAINAALGITESDESGQSEGPEDDGFNQNRDDEKAFAD